MFKLIPGQSLCSNCFVKFNDLVENNVESETSDKDPDYIDDNVVAESLDSACISVGLSPVKIRKVAIEKRASVVKKTLSKIQETVKNNLKRAYGENYLSSSDDEVEESSLCKEYCDLISKLKKKIKEVTAVSDKVKILSIAPESWSIEKTATEFSVSEYLVRLTRMLVKEQGVFPALHKRKEGTGSPLPKSDIEKVILFYSFDDISRMCPGMKDFKSVKNADGTKEQVQKRLLLLNLKEAHIQFLVDYPETGISFSTFAVLRPKYIILAGPKGTHNVCVCEPHQNIKLMLEGGGIVANYKDLLAEMVCDIDNEKCMLHCCEDCPGKHILTKKLQYVLNCNDETEDETISYKQWIKTDRCDIITVLDSLSDYITK